MPTGHTDRRHKNRSTAALLAGRPPSHALTRSGKESREGQPQGGSMPTLSTRTFAALAFERGEDFDPALTLPSAPLSEDLARLAAARAVMCELSPTERRRRRERGACAA